MHGRNIPKGKIAKIQGTQYVPDPVLNHLHALNQPSTLSSIIIQILSSLCSYGN